jgi:hypothetical protein
MRGRQTARFPSAVESKQPQPAFARPAFPAGASGPMPQQIPDPVLEVAPLSTVAIIPEPILEAPQAQQLASAQETVVMPAFDAPTIVNFAETAPLRKSFWAEIHEPPILQQALIAEPPAAPSEETIVVAPLPGRVAVAGPTPEPEVESTASIAASRLSGLRTLMTSLGVKNLHKEQELRKAQTEFEPLVERPTERPVFAQPQWPAPLSTDAIQMPVPEVTASPEIIPPRIAIEPIERNPVERDADLRRPAKASRVSRWDTADDMDTLPSKRGQYRKRH